MILSKQTPIKKIAASFKRNKSVVIVEEAENKLVLKNVDDKAGILFFIFIDEDGLFRINAATLVLKFKTYDEALEGLKMMLNARGL